MKRWYCSKTLWFNMFIALGAAIESQTELLKPYIGVSGYTMLVMLVPAINAGLRFMSTTELTK